MHHITYSKLGRDHNDVLLTLACLGNVFTRRLTQALRQLRELVDVLTGVSAVWDTEAKVKVKALQQVITEVVPLNHAEVVQRPVSNCEFHPDWTIEREGRRRCNNSVVMTLLQHPCRFRVSS